jgi:hypothetical protein
MSSGVHRMSPAGRRGGRGCGTSGGSRLYLRRPARDRLGVQQGWPVCPPSVLGIADGVVKEERVAEEASSAIVRGEHLRRARHEIDEQATGHDHRSFAFHLSVDGRAQRQLHVRRCKMEPAGLDPQQDPRQDLDARPRRDGPSDDSQLLQRARRAGQGFELPCRCAHVPLIPPNPDDFGGHL